jgi:hypothetical protein
VENVKLAILADRKAYEYAYSLLDSASKRLRLESVEQITEDFLRLLVAHVISEGGGQPTKDGCSRCPSAIASLMSRDIEA